MKRSLIAVLAGSSLLLAACTVGSTDTTGGAEPLSFPSPAQAGGGRGTGKIEQVVQRVLPAVVNVVARNEEGEGEGTGFVVREDGIIVTNAHVVEGASEVTIFTSDDEPREFSARVIGGDIEADLAVLDVDAEGMATVPLGDSDALDLGQQVVAIGYALGLEGGPSVTSGIVSSLTRRITVPDAGCVECAVEGQRVYAAVIQTDAAINPGNSGGPLVDLAGNVVGINTAGTTSAENVGFAIQINAAKPVIEQAAAEPNAPIAFMGIGAQDAGDPGVQAQLDPPTDEGALILDVVPGGPADQAGVEIGDVVIAFDGEPTPTAEALGEAIRSHDPGEVVEVDLIRASGEAASVTVELGSNELALT